MERELQQFINTYVAELRPIVNKLSMTRWQYDTTGDESLSSLKNELETRYVQIHSDVENFDRLKNFANSEKIENPVLQRQLKILINAFQLHQGEEKKITEMVELETKIASTYNHFRGKVDGKALNDNEIKNILQHETDNSLREKTWQASKQIGAEVADDVLHLVRLRNQNAKKAGYKNYYEMALACQELNENKMSETLGRLKELSDEPFRNFKKQLDGEQAERFGIAVDDMRSWHYGDPFFQALPPHGNIDMDRFFTETNISQLMQDSYQSIGLDIDGILKKSDLYPKEGKCQHAYCTTIDREKKDVRVLCNVNQSSYWISTMLHEFGHAVYDQHLGDDLPYLLKNPAHILSTEAIAMLMDSLVNDRSWLAEMVGVPSQELDKIGTELDDRERLAQLIFVRWGLVMVNFERELYTNPEQDLNTLWWDYVEEFQLIKRPKNRNEPDWAAKIHLALAPVYYQNYIYGQMIASQLSHYIRSHIGNGKLYDNQELGSYLIESYFRSGSTWDWNNTLAKATKENLNPDYYVKESLHGYTGTENQVA